jgi:hypothetical protein
MHGNLNTFHQNTIKRNSRPCINNTTGQELKAYWNQESNRLELLPADAACVSTGDVILVDSIKLMVIDIAQKEHGVILRSVKKVFVFAELLRPATTPQDSFGRPSGNLETIATDVPLIQRGKTGTVFETSGFTPARPGDTLIIGDEIYTIQQTSHLPSKLLVLETVKQSYCWRSSKRPHFRPPEGVSLTPKS